MITKLINNVVTNHLVCFTLCSSPTSCSRRRTSPSSWRTHCTSPRRQSQTDRCPRPSSAWTPPQGSIPPPGPPAAGCLGDRGTVAVGDSRTSCRVQWLRVRASDSRLREPRFESCAAVLKPWASFFTLHCSSSLSCKHEYLSIDSGDYVFPEKLRWYLIEQVCWGWKL